MAKLTFNKNNSESTTSLASDSSIGNDRQLQIVNKLQNIVSEWNGNEVITAHHEQTNSWIFIARHDTRLGPATGGCRIQNYASPEAGLKDALRLAEGMTQKWAILRATSGGGKAVIAIPPLLSQAERTTLLEYFARMVEKLEGRFQTAGDFGTTASDLETMAKFTTYLHCFDQKTGSYIDSAFYTAVGVYYGIRSSLRKVFGDEDPRGRTIVIQGVGQVGGALLKMLSRAGARILVSDCNPERIASLNSEAELRVVPVRSAHSVSCDVYSPCALGGVVNETSVTELDCLIVAGGANNQLANERVAAELHERCILYAPDYVINAGGALALPMFARGANKDEVVRAVCMIGDTLTAVFDEAALFDESPYYAAGRRARRILQEHTFSFAGKN